MSFLSLFPLGTVLTPGARIPLQVFEERYVELVSDLLHSSDTPEFGIVALRSGREVGGGLVELHQVGCSAILEHVDDLDDGRYTVRARGERRFRIEELVGDDDVPYLRARVSWLPEPDGDVSRVPSLAKTVRQRLIAHRLLLGLDAGIVVREGRGDPIADARAVAYRVGDLVPLPLWERQDLLEAPDLVARLDLGRRLLRREHELVTRLRALPHTVDSSSLCPN